MNTEQKEHSGTSSPNFGKPNVMRSTVFNEDCMSVMARFPDKHFDLAIVDPPYRDVNHPIKEMRKNGQMDTIKGRPNDDYWNELYRVSKSQIIWGANNYNFDFKGFVVWNKMITGVKGKYSDVEIASLSEDLGTTSVIYNFPVQNSKEGKIHPNQKPSNVYTFLLQNYSKEGSKVLDTHLGSGSSRIAAHKHNLEFVGCEIDVEYYEAQEARFKDFTAQLRLFG